MKSRRGADQERVEELFARDGFARRFELTSPLGSGATVVYLALDQKLAEKVVLKFLDLPAENDLRCAVLAGLRAALRLNSEFVVATHEVISASSCACLVLEYVDGKTLAELVTNGEGLPFVEAQLILAAVGRGLNDIHRSGLLHRDLKLDNVMVSAAGKVKIVDLGFLAPIPLAERPAKPETWIDTAEWITGTPANLPPEYFRSGHFDVHGELYTLGCLAYELVTGSTPFPEAGFLELVQAKLNRPPIAISEITPECPPEFASWIMKLLATDPAQRYDSAAEALDALLKIGAAKATDYPQQSPPNAARESLERLVNFCDQTQSLQRVVPYGESILALSDAALTKIAWMLTSFVMAIMVLLAFIALRVFTPAEADPRSFFPEITEGQLAREITAKRAVQTRVSLLPVAQRYQDALARIVIGTHSGELYSLLTGAAVAASDLDQASPQYEVVMTRWPRRDICPASGPQTSENCLVSGEQDFASPTAAYPAGIFYLIREKVSEPDPTASRAAEIWFQASGTRRQMTTLHQPITHLIAAGDSGMVFFITPASDGGSKVTLFLSSGAGEEVALGELNEIPKNLSLTRVR